MVLEKQCLKWLKNIMKVPNLDDQLATLNKSRQTCDHSGPFMDMPYEDDLLGYPATEMPKYDSEQAILHLTNVWTKKQKA